MAHASNTGLNAVSEFGVPLTGHPKRFQLAKAWDFVTGRQPTATNMESGKTSRLPRFGFGFRKSSHKASLEQSNGTKSNGSPGSSPGVSRSKSMRVSRLHPSPKITKQSNSLEEDEELSKQKESLQVAARLRPPQVKKNSHSQPNSRSASPHFETSSSYMSDSVSSQDSMGSTRQTKTSPLLARDHGHARSNSLHTREKMATTGKQPQSSGMASSAGSMNGLPRGRAMTSATRPHIKNDYRSTKVGWSKMESVDQVDGGVESRPVAGGAPMKKNEPLANKARRGSAGSIGGLGRRPSSMVFLEDPHDLNKLASEMSGFDGEVGQEGKSERHAYQSRLPGITRQRSPACVRHGKLRFKDGRMNTSPCYNIV